MCYSGIEGVWLCLFLLVVVKDNKELILNFVLVFFLVLGCAGMYIIMWEFIKYNISAQGHLTHCAEKDHKIVTKM